MSSISDRAREKYLQGRDAPDVHLPDGLEVPHIDAETVRAAESRVTNAAFRARAAIGDEALRLFVPEGLETDPETGEYVEGEAFYAAEADYGRAVWALTEAWGDGLTIAELLDADNVGALAAAYWAASGPSPQGMLFELPREGVETSGRFERLARHTDDGGEPVVPEALEGTQAAARVLARWRDDRDEARVSSRSEVKTYHAEALALYRTIKTLALLEDVAELAADRGHITPLWERSVYLEVPEPFGGLLPAILGAMAGTRDDVERPMLREVMEHARPGSWANVSAAAEAIDDDYSTARLWARTEPGRADALDALGEAVGTANRYRALRSAAVTEQGRDMVEAVLDARTNPARIVALARPEARTLGVGQLVGQGHLSSLIQQVRDGELEPSVSWTVNRGTSQEHAASLTLEAAPRAVEALKRIKEQANLTDAGICDLADAAWQTVRAATGKVGGDGAAIVRSTDFVKARGATTTSETVHHKGKDQQGRVRDVDAFLEAASYIHVRATYWARDEHGTWQRVRIDRPLFIGEHIEFGIDDAGNPVGSAWRVWNHSMDVFAETGLVRGKTMPLLDTGEGTRRLDDLEASFRHFVDAEVVNLEHAYEHTGRKTLEIGADRLANLGPGDAGMSGPKRRRFMDRLAGICLGPKGGKGRLLTSIERAYSGDEGLSEIRIRPVTKQGNRRKGKEPKTLLVGLTLTLTKPRPGLRAPRGGKR